MKRSHGAGIPFLVVVAILAFFSGCGKDKSSSPSGSATGTLSIQLTDAPAVFDKVNVTFSEVAVNTQSDTTKNGWMVIKGDSQTIDLLTLANGVTVVLGEKELDPGKYGQIRLKLTKAEVVVAGVTHPLTVPSGSTSGLKLGGGFTIEEGVKTELVVDFDAARSIHMTGKKGEYMLNPRLRLTAKAVSGGVSGGVTNYQDAPVAYAIAGADTVASTPVKKDTGRFLLGFLPAGTYTVAVSDTLKKAFTKTGVSVTAGNVSDIGSVTLQ